MTTLRTATATALLTALVVVAGCGGGSDESGAPKAPVSSAPTSGSGLVTADATQGLVGPSERATKGKTSFSDKSGKISPKASGKTGAQKHGVAAGADCANSGITPTPDNLADANAAILCLVNAERADNGGLPPLANNPQLQKAAEGMAGRMVAEQFFSHETPDGKTVVDRIEPTGYIPSSDDWVVGENLAWGSGALSTPQAIVNGWMNSPGHRANMLAADYKDIGLAAAMGSPSPSQKGGTVYVNNFGARSGANAEITLPGHEDTATDTATTAATKKATAKKKAKKKHKKRKKHKKH
jgi:uncharacterized protein YkwD